MNFPTSLRTILLALILSIGISYAYAAWSPPTSSPTLGNTDAPVNVGTAGQTKSGALTIGQLLTAYGTLRVGSYTTETPPVDGMIVKGNVGIGAVSPTAKLDVAGPIKIANTSATCSSVADAGLMRYNGKFQGCDGLNWVDLGGAGPPPPPPIPTVTLNQSDADAKIPIEYSVALSWASTDATACAVETSSSPGWSGGKPLSGSEAITPPSAGNKTYTLTCTNSSGSASDSVVINVRPWTTVTGYGVVAQSCRSWLASSGQSGIDGSPPRMIIPSSGYNVVDSCAYDETYRGDTFGTQCTLFQQDQTGGTTPIDSCTTGFTTQTRR